MQPEQKLRVLGDQAVFDVSVQEVAGSPGGCPARDKRWIYPTALPDGTRVPTLKILMDSACQNDCGYCAQRAGRDTPRERFEPEELARTFREMLEAGQVEGLFLSSGLGGDAVRTMDRMIAAAEILRTRAHFKGYIHLKVLPGAERSQVERAAQLAQRLSINLEAPGARRLARLSHDKDFQAGILERMWWIAHATRDPRSLARGHTTQFVVGASDETDREIVSASSRLYRDYHLSRVYYSAFRPVPRTPLEHRPPAPPMRQHRLYQADFLLRRYGFAFEELRFGADGNLSLHHDPKTAWAIGHPERFPLEVNRASREELLRIPGLGPWSVERILTARRRAALAAPSDLLALARSARRSLPYLLFNGRAASCDADLFERVRVSSDP